MSPELEKAIAATKNVAAWDVAASNGPEGQEARQVILAEALTAAGVKRSDAPAEPAPAPALRVTVTFPLDADAKAFGAILEAARAAGATGGSVVSDDAPGLVFTETYLNGQVMR